MTQAQFFQAVAEGSQVSKAQVRAVFAAVEDVVMKRLKGEGKIPLGGLGAVKLVDRKARIGRNPATGEQIKIPAKTVVKITPSKSMKDTFNKKGKKLLSRTSTCGEYARRPTPAGVSFWCQVGIRSSVRTVAMMSANCTGFWR